MKRRLVLKRDSCYHVMSRVIERRFYLGDVEKEMFRNMLIRVAHFSGVEVLNYCIMNNHFHILVRVPEAREIGDKELLGRIRNLYRGNALKEAIAEFEWCSKAGNEHLFDLLRQRYVARMYDLSQFMKSLKQRYAIWYNRNHDRMGTLWEGDRFTSVLVEGGKRSDSGFGSRALLIMSAYIDLNPVRAGLTDDPKDYHWCGYSEALSGRKGACCNLMNVILSGYGNDQALDFSISEEMALERYRLLLFEEGAKGHGFDRKRIRGVLAKGGRLSQGELLRCRVRYFCAGAVLGCKAFVDDAMKEGQSYFGTHRRTSAQRLKGGDWGDLCSARQLHVNVLS